MSAQLKETQSIAELSASLNRRDVLLGEYKQTTDADYCQRVEICRELANLFESRTDWQRKHQSSYNWALARGVVPRIPRKGMHNGRPVEFSSASDLSRIAKARDELHDYCCMHLHGYAKEFFAGQVFTQHIKSGNSIESALEVAKQTLITGMAE
jgi:hypothetical protein